MEQKNFYYSPVIILLPIIVYGIPLLEVIGDIALHVPIERMIYDMAIPVFFGLPLYIPCYRATADFFNKKPAITLESMYFTDHFFNIELRWDNIRDITSSHPNSDNFYLRFMLIDQSEITQQINNPVSKLFYFVITSLMKCSYLFNTYLITGNDADTSIFKEIEKYRGQSK